MMYEDNRDGILTEYTDKLMAEVRAGVSLAPHVQEHFIRGLVSDIVDRVHENPKRYSQK